MVFIWDFHWIPMGSLWYFYDGSIIFLWNFYWIPVGFPRYLYTLCVYDISMGLLWEFLWDFFAVPMLFPCYIYDLSIGISMIFLLDYFEIN